MNDSCTQCGQELRVTCPSCGRLVLVTKGLLAAHDAPTVHAGHMTWGSCKGSRSIYVAIEKYKVSP